MTGQGRLRQDTCAMQAAKFLPSSLAWICRQQLITGEMTAYRAMRGGASCWPAPLFSVLVRDLLACADPHGIRFSRRLYEALPPRDRRGLTSAVVTLRWRLRGYVASQQGTDGLWRLHGRDGDSPVDVVTTALATAMFFEDRGTSFARTRMLAEELKSRTAGNILSEAAILYLLAVAGKDVQKTGEALLGLGNVDGIQRLTSCWLLARAWGEALSYDAMAWRERMAADVLDTIQTMGDGGTMANAMALVALLQLQYRGKELDLLLSLLLDKTDPPWNWGHEPLHSDISSPSFVLSLIVSALAQMLDLGRPAC
jgi:hypothetical protein